MQKRIIGRIEALAVNPRPHGVEKLAGKDQTYRVRVGGVMAAMTSGSVPSRAGGSEGQNFPSTMSPGGPTRSPTFASDDGSRFPSHSGNPNHGRKAPHGQARDHSDVEELSLDLARSFMSVPNG